MAKDHPTGQSGLYEAFLQLKTPEQCYRFLQDVCSYSELSAMEQRFNIAEMLADMRIYTEIMDKTGASSAIISRVSRVLSADGSVLRELLEATRALAPEIPRLRIALVGEGPMRAELASLAAQCGSEVVFAGAQPPDEVARWMAAANLVTLPSYSEGHPNVLVEALACGRGVVATPVGGIPEVVDATSGVLVPPRDAAALVEGLRAGLARDWDETALARRFSRSWTVVAQETLHACEKALHSRR